MEELSKDLLPDPKVLKELLWYQMPFGKYKGSKLRALPSYYLEWFSAKGFPKGKLGMLMSTMFVIRTHGLDFLLDQLEDIQEGQIEYEAE